MAGGVRKQGADDGSGISVPPGHNSPVQDHQMNSSSIRSPKPRRAKWLIALTATAVLGGAAYVVMGIRHALDEGPQERTMACSKAMSEIGWKLPENASDQECTSLTDLAARTLSGTFRMPRAAARPWLAALPGDRGNPTNGAGSDGVAESKDGLTFMVRNPPGKQQPDAVQVEVRWEGQETAAVTFQTFDY
ncbi:hypothetical protein AB0A70_12680 [Streptomyces morookaense]|uniref:hypothetical protein n=1 Tax=Streptomyces morookaense TaxID=1970 RepID=UPI0033E66948